MYQWLHKAVLIQKIILILAALGASILGGVFWFVMWKDLGGPDEPHGIWTVIWAIVTMLPSCMVLIGLNKYGSAIGVGKFIGVPVSRQTAFYTLFMLGFVIGAYLFYNLPMGNVVGFRKYFEASKLTFIEREVALVSIWTSLLALPSFLLMTLGVLAVRAHSLFGILSPDTSVRTSKLR